MDIEGYSGDEVIIELIPKGPEVIPAAAAGLKRIPILSRDKDKELNVLNPKVTEIAKGSLLKITIPACNCEKISIRVPQDSILSILPRVFGSEGKLTVKNINNEVQVLGWFPVIELNHVAGFIFSTGGSNIVPSNKIILKNIQWTAKPVMFNGKLRPRYYSVGANSATIDISVPLNLGASVIYNIGSGKFYTDFNTRPGTPTAEQRKGFQSQYSSNEGLEVVNLNNGGININLRTYSGNIFLRREY